MAKLLIVDDVPDNVTLLTMELEDQGYEILTASDGHRGLELAGAERPDVILLDVMMPGMNGIEVCRRLKEDPQTANIPVILVTAMGLDENVVAGLDAGADDYVSKPFNHQVLAARIRAALRVKASFDAVEASNQRLREEMGFRRKAEEALRRRDEELRQAQKMEAVGSLAGGIAHEFNNLLQVIRGYSRFAMDELAPDGQPYQDLEQVLTAVDRAAELTSQLLRFSRSRELQKQSVDLNDVLRSLSAMLRPLLGERIELEMVLDEDVGTVQADPTALQQILMNLCINARDAMPSGGKLTIRTQQTTIGPAEAEVYPDVAPGRYVRIAVTDTGCGMPPEVRKRVFEPFFTTKEVGKGTGLGLSVAYGVIQEHRGMIHVYSEVGRGTIFKIYLPLQPDHSSVPRADDRQPMPTGTETILVAEDEPVVRQVAVRVLRGAGYTTLEAEDGAQALQVLRERGEEVDLLLIDVVMPHLTGHEVYQQLNELGHRIPVVFCTGYDPAGGQMGFIQQAGLPLVEKPFDPDQLLRVIRETLDQHAHWSVGRADEDRDGALAVQCEQA